MTQHQLTGESQPPFRLALLLLPRSFRIEVTDTRPERLPSRTAPPSADETSGRGLLLVQAYADRWGCDIRDAYTKTVWAEVCRPDEAPEE
ncbi:ATP-binding protein [Streptomyces sp. NPDC001843]|uniref:ATP-binding protein n=1 Tax=Streptomyces sp. NPDC001843 TaxID=3364617 RepID=UPI00367A4DE0